MRRELWFTNRTYALAILRAAIIADMPDVQAYARREIARYWDGN